MQNINENIKKAHLNTNYLTFRENVGQMTFIRASRDREMTFRKISVSRAVEIVA